MKKNCFVWLTIVLGTLVAVGCGSSLNDKEEKIVGKWHSYLSESMDEDEIDEDLWITAFSISGESEDEYFADHTMKDDGPIIFSFHVEDGEYDEWIDLVYDVTYEATWSVDGDKLIEKGNKVDIGFSHFTTMQEYDPDFDDYYINTLKSIVEEMLPELRHECLKKSTSTIIDLSEDEMTLENEDGEETTYVRIE